MIVEQLHINSEGKYPRTGELLCSYRRSEFGALDTEIPSHEVAGVRSYFFRARAAKLRAKPTTAQTANTSSWST